MLENNDGNPKIYRQEFSYGADNKNKMTSIKTSYYDNHMNKYQKEKYYVNGKSVSKDVFYELNDNNKNDNQIVAENDEIIKKL